MGKKPTAKQAAFAHAVVAGKFRAMSDAYREIYSSRGSRETVKDAASKLWKSPTVQAEADRIRRRLEADRSRRYAGDRDAIRRRLWSIADDESARDGDVIQACKLLGQASGMWVEVRENTTHTASTEAELIEEIRAALEGKSPGDVSAPEVESDPTLN